MLTVMMILSEDLSLRISNLSGPSITSVRRPILTLSTLKIMKICTRVFCVLHISIQHSNPIIIRIIFQFFYLLGSWSQIASYPV